MSRLGQLLTSNRHTPLPTEEQDEEQGGLGAPSASASSPSSSRRQVHHPLVETVPEDEPADNHANESSSGAGTDVEQGLTASSNSNNNNNDSEIIEMFPNTRTRSSRRSSSRRSSNQARQVVASTTPAAATATATTTSNNNNSITLAELEEERELARRRVSFCVLLAVFVLFRLWLEALATGDFFLMMLCLFGTSWTARFIRHNREHEEALDERIRLYLEERNSNVEDSSTSIDRDDLRNLSFQAQLALALMESQRQMQLGGYGNPDGYNGEDGVSETAKNQWEEFAWKDGMEETGTLKRSSLTNSDNNINNPSSKYTDEAPHCSICLGDYENEEQLVRLPCNHIYHKDCISSWTDNHTRCPLCNMDLESVSGSENDTADTATMTTANTDNSIV